GNRGHDGALRSKHDHLVARARTRVDVGMRDRDPNLRQHFRIRVREHGFTLSATLWLTLREREGRQQKRHCSGTDLLQRYGVHMMIVNTRSALASSRVNARRYAMVRDMSGGTARTGSERQAAPGHRGLEVGN